VPRQARAVVSLTVLGAVLRFATLDARGYWSDEVATVRVLGGGLLDVLRRVPSTEATPPLYYVLAWAWVNVFGSGEVGLRSFSALAGTATVPVAYAVGAALGTRRVGVAAAVLVAVSPLLVWYSQEARAYALLALLGGVSLLLAIRARERPDVRRLGAWAVAAVLVVWTHYYGLFLVVVEAAWLLASVRPRRGPLLAAAPVGIAAVALVPLVLAQTSDTRTDWIADIPLVTRVLDLPAVYLIGFGAPRPVALAALAVALVLPALWALARRAGRDERAAALTAGGLTLAALALPLLPLLAGFDHFLHRNMLAAAVPAAVFFAAGFGARRAGRAVPAALAAYCALALAVIAVTAWEPKLGREDWRTVAELLGEPAHDRAVVATPRARADVLRYYLGAERFESGSADVREVAVVGMARAARPGALQRPRTPRPSSPPPPPAAGFRLVQRVDEEHFTLFRYRAPASVRVPSSALAGLAFGRERGEMVLLERAAVR
jgi:mannosyltransferase